MVMGNDLLATLTQQAEYAAYYKTQAPVACPNDGEPLKSGPPSSPGVYYCPFGDFRYPDDWNPESMSGM